MMCVFGRLMSQLSDVNTQSTDGMWHFYVVLHCCFSHWCRVLTFLWETDSDSDSWTSIGNGSWSARANGAAALMWPSIQRTNVIQQPVNTPPINHSGPSPRKHSPDGATKAHIRLQLTTQFNNPERMKGWAAYSWLTCSGRFTHKLVTRQMQVERRTGKVHRPKTDVLPLCHATNLRCPLKI